MTERHTVKRAEELAATSDDKSYGVLLEHGSMELGFYKPDKIDPQQGANTGPAQGAYYCLDCACNAR